ncbi:MAG: M48 family metallopeptidase [Candidatus Pacebacteria bacterium]|nr:M48 family metallopeptidase [Candidatus Paceibacterota bacterium]
MKIDKLVRTKRKTVALQISDRAEVVIRAPRWVSVNYILSFVSKHADWIEKRKKEINKKQVRTKKFVDGEEFLFLGEKYVLFRTLQGPSLGRARSVVLEGGVLYLPESIDDPKSAFEKWYKKKAKEYITRRVKEFARENNFEYNNIRITSARTRWGSCSGKKNLSFSWRLILAPQKVVDYVIVHELAHLRHMNHSKLFWHQVEQLCPAYKEYKRWLRDKAENLSDI